MLAVCIGAAFFYLVDSVNGRREYLLDEVPLDGLLRFPNLLVRRTSARAVAFQYPLSGVTVALRATDRKHFKWNVHVEAPKGLSHEAGVCMRCADAVAEE